MEEESEGERRSSRRVLARMEEMGANASGEVDSVNLYLNYTHTQLVLPGWGGGRVARRCKNCRGCKNKKKCENPMRF